ncbi:MAG: hypothetical protein DMF03_04730 [Verrucomicrobia bacterium]|nr:MAG: hypothetical protein DMF03_04730 [Verrucomicrobiota bacterium]
MLGLANTSIIVGDNASLFVPLAPQFLFPISRSAGARGRLRYFHAFVGSTDGDHITAPTSVL